MRALLLISLASFLPGCITVTGPRQPISVDNAQEFQKLKEFKVRLVSIKSGVHL